MHEHRFMSAELLLRVAYPVAVVCVHCDAVEGHGLPWWLLFAGVVMLTIPTSWRFLRMMNNRSVQ